MPAYLDSHAMTIRFELPDQQTYFRDSSGLPCKQLLNDLLQGLCLLTHPHGQIRRVATVKHYLANINLLAKELSAQHFEGGAKDLSTAELLHAWRKHGRVLESYTKLVLRAFDTIHNDLTPSVREQINGRPIQAKLKSTPHRPYTETEWKRLENCCEKLIDSSYKKHVQMRNFAERRDLHDGVDAHTLDLVRWMLKAGPSTLEDYYGRPGNEELRDKPFNRAKLHEVRETLFPTDDIQFAYRLLFGMRTGIVPDGMDDLNIGDIEWAGDSTILVKYFKGRTGPEGLTISRNAISVLSQWLDHSKLLRTFAQGDLRETLWLYVTRQHTNRQNMIHNGTSSFTMNARFVKRNYLQDDTGAPLKLHRSRIRTTYLRMLAARGWTGRTAIDPNHSAQVEGDHYLSTHTPGQLDALESVVEDGQSDIIKKSLSPIASSDFEMRQMVDELSLKASNESVRTPVTDLVTGEQDVFVGACKDHLSGLWGPAGKPCPARPWVCLLCPLAVFTPKHAVNLLRLKAYFARQFRRMTLDDYLRVFGPYSQRLDNDILPRFDQALLVEAANSVSSNDAEIPLRPEEMT